MTWSISLAASLSWTSSYTLLLGSVPESQRSKVQSISSICGVLGAGVWQSNLVEQYIFVKLSILPTQQYLNLVPIIMFKGCILEGRHGLHMTALAKVQKEKREGVPVMPPPHSLLSTHDSGKWVHGNSHSADSHPSDPASTVCGRAHLQLCGRASLIWAEELTHGVWVVTLYFL